MTFRSGKSQIAVSVLMAGVALWVMPIGRAQASECQTSVASVTTGPTDLPASGTPLPGGGNCAVGEYWTEGAASVPDPGATPGVFNDNKLGAVVVTDGETVNLGSDAGTYFDPGLVGVTYDSLGTYFANGQFVTGDPNAARVELGARSETLLVPDPETGGTLTISTYNTGNIDETNWADSTRYADYYHVKDRQYIDARLGHVDETGGTLNVDIGNSDLNSPMDQPQKIRMAAKGSTLTYADGTSNAATVNWQSRNLILMEAATAPTDFTQNITLRVATFGGTFTDALGVEHSVTDEASLQAYNDYLRTEMNAGNLVPVDGARDPIVNPTIADYQALYDSEFAKAISFSDEAMAYNISADDLNDRVFDAVGPNIVIHADGANATGTITSTGQIDHRLNNGSAAVLATNGGTITNDGALSGHYTSMRIDGTGTGATSGANNGVVSAGYFQGENWDTSQAGGYPEFHAYVEGYAVEAFGDNASFDNNGVINVAGWTWTELQNGQPSPENFGIKLSDGAEATNTGQINVGVNNNFTSGSVSGAIVDGGTFTSTGGITIGQSAQYALGDPTVDVANAGAQYGIRATAGNGPSVARNDGTITIRAGVGNATAMVTSATEAGSELVNSGTIDILGTHGGRNVGMYAYNNGDGTDSRVVNEGTINLDGANGIALFVQSVGSSNAHGAISNTGTVNVAGGLSPTTGARNYGVWAEGINAEADIDGAINLTGNRAVGVHARAGAEVNLSAGNTVNFSGGTNQIGYFVHGAGSTINTNATSLDVSTDNSVLFRIENGASFDGTNEDGDPISMTASGAGSTAIQGTGANVNINLGTGNVVVVSGDGATAVRIDGGAVGTIDANADIQLTGPNSIAGQVDGRKHNINDTYGDPAQTSTLTNDADIASAAGSAVGLVTQWGGTLENNGLIDLDGADSTGVIARSGGVLNNDADIEIADGTGILVEGGGPWRTDVSNTANIVVTDGVAGIHVRNGGDLDGSGIGGTISANGSAHGVLVGTDAAGVSLGVVDITTEAAGTGNGIENAGELEGIAFAGTTINMHGTGAGVRTGVSTTEDSTVTVNANGAGSVGYAFELADGSATAKDLDIGSGYDIHVTGTGAHGLTINTTGTAATAATIDVDADGGSAIHILGAAETINTGVLTSQSTEAVVDLSAAAGGTVFTNAGSIIASAFNAIAVTGSSGDDVVNLEDEDVTGVVAMGDGTDIVNWTGGTLDGSIEMGAGDNDALTLNGVNLATLYHADGGAGAGDTLTLQNLTHSGGSFDSFADDDLVRGLNVGSDWETINLINAIFTLTDDLVFGDNLDIGSTSTLFAGNGLNPVLGDAVSVVNNSGVLALTNGAADTSVVDVVTVLGDYAGLGASEVWLNTYLGTDTSPTDLLVVNGDTSGSSRLRIARDADSPGARTTGDGIMVVDVGGDSSGVFTSPKLFAGAYEYNLFQGGLADPDDGNWYLRSDISTGTQTIEAFSSALLGFSHITIGTLQQRTGNRQWAAHDDCGNDPWLRSRESEEERHRRETCRRERSSGFTDAAFGDPIVGGGVWARVVGHFAKAAPETGTGYEQDIWFGQVGAEGVVIDRDSGVLVLGVMGTYGTQKVDVAVTASPVDGSRRSGSVDTDALGIGANLTWLGSRGLYIDAVGQYTWQDSDLSSSDFGAIVEGARSDAYALSLELGQKFEARPGLVFVPQGQIIYSNLSVEDFTMGNPDSEVPNSAAVRATGGESLLGRLGVRVETVSATQDARRYQAYGIANLLYEFMGDTETTVGGERFSQEPRKFWGEVGLGGTYEFSERASLYGEARYAAAFESAGDNHYWAANLGLRVNW